MKLIDQCCTKDQGKRLKELGVSIESYFLWSKTKDEPFEGWALEGDEDEFYGAYTVAELMQMLPRYYPSWRCLEEGGKKEFWIATVIGQPEGYERDKEDVLDIRTVAAFDRYGKTQAEALATLLIALLETNAITAEEVNKRLQA